VTFAHPLPGWAIVAGIASALGLAALSYWRARQVLAPPRLVLLVALRAMVLLLVAALWLRPVRVEPQPQSAGRVALLVDVSASMSLTDEGGRSRFDAAVAAIRELLPALGTTFSPEVMGFGERLGPLDLAAARPDARESRLGLALSELGQRARERPLAGAIVFSDGAVDLDEGPGTWGSIPVFAVGVGASIPARDREVYGLSIGDSRVQGSLVDLSALVVGHGDSSQPVQVTIEEGGRPVDVRHLVLPPGGVPQRVTARVAPSRDAPTVYTVSVSEADGELTTRNNRQSVLAPPAGEPRRVLLVEGAPAFEHGFLKRSLAEDAGLQVDAIVRKGSNESGQDTFYVQADAGQAPQLTSGFPSTKAALFRYDVVLAANLDAAALTRDQMAQLQDFVAVRGGGLVLFGTRTFESRALVGTPLEDVVPVELVDKAGGLARVSSGTREPHRVVLTGSGEDHPVMRLGPGPGDTRMAWAAAPAVAAVASLGDPRPGATLLATTSAPGGVARPLVAVQRFGRGRAVVFAGEASWRWKMMLPAGDRTYDTFWRQAVRWAGGDAWGPVALTAAAHGSRIVASAEVRDELFVSARDAQARLEAIDPSGEVNDVTVSWPRGDRARAVGQLVAGESGVYQLAVEARRGGTSLGAARAWALVGGADGEFVNPRRDDAVLRRAAEATGGRALTLAEVPDLPRWLREAVRPPEAMAERDLWHVPWVFLLVFGMLGAEWTLRRRWGLR
jgi:uncharacterized membrane protein